MNLDFDKKYPNILSFNLINLNFLSNFNYLLIIIFLDY